MSAVPSFQFRGVFLPAQIVEKIVNNGITRAEVLLLVVIEAFVESGKGCWASNSYLSKILKLNKTWVSESINGLINKGLLRSKEVDGVRWLETCWSGEMDREGYSGKTEGGTVKTEPPLREKPNQNIRIEYKDNDRSIFTKKRSAKSIDPKFLDWAKRLERVINQVYKLSPDFHLIKWARAFQSGYKQIQGDDSRIDYALDLLQKNGHEFPVTCPKHFFNQLLYIEQSAKKKNSPQGKLCQNCNKCPAIVFREGNGGWLCKNCKEIW